LWTGSCQAGNDLTVSVAGSLLGLLLQLVHACVWCLAAVPDCAAANLLQTHVS
jgi:hypothetical protein